MSNKTDAIMEIAMTEQETIKELNRLADLYHKRKKEFDKASRIRWILTFVGFTLVFLIIIFLFSQATMKDMLKADIRTIGTILLIACLFSGGHMYFNVAIFGWLFQKDIAEGRRLDDIEKRIRELEKTLK
jgi:uncharacterized membrane protein